MFPIYADAMMTATRMNEPMVTPDYRHLHPRPTPSREKGLSLLWWYLS